MIKAAEDKTYPGAFVAAPADPWGQSMFALTTHAGYTYRSVFARDSYETFTGLLADGDRASAREMVRFLFDRAQQPDGSFPRDSLVNGAVAPDTYGLFEIDEDAYPLLMAWQAGVAGNRALYAAHLRPDADFVVSHGPAYGEERWEEHMGYSPASIASEIAGLTAAAHLAQAAGDPARARLYQATADDYQRHVKAWTVTDSGPYGDHRYFLRLAVDGDPNAATTYNLNNGSLSNVDQRRVVDAGFLELTRLGVLSAHDADVTRSPSSTPCCGARRPRVPAGTATGSRPTAAPTGMATATNPTRRTARRAARRPTTPSAPAICGRSSTGSGPSRRCRPVAWPPPAPSRWRCAACRGASG